MFDEWPLRVVEQFQKTSFLQVFFSRTILKLNKALIFVVKLFDFFFCESALLATVFTAAVKK